MIRPVAAVFLSVVLLTGACTHPTYFAQPLAPPGEAAYDPRLIGTWVARSDGESSVIQLSIAPSGSGGKDRELVVTALLSGLEADPDNQAHVAFFERIAHPTEIGGVTYYNIRASEPGSRFATMDSTGTHAPPPKEIEWFVTPEHAAREFWIAKAHVADDGLLRLRFIAMNQWRDEAYRGGELKQFVARHAAEIASSTMKCGEACEYARAEIDPALLARIIRSFPEHTVFNIEAGPFARMGAALPEFGYEVSK